MGLALNIDIISTDLNNMHLFLFAVPCPNLYIQLNALQLTLDPRSMLWLNQFILDLRQSLEQFTAIYKLDSGKEDEHVDIRVDGLMLKVYTMRH